MSTDASESSKRRCRAAARSWRSGHATRSRRKRSSRRRKRRSRSSLRSGTRNAEQKSVAPHLPLGLPQPARRLPRRWRRSIRIANARRHGSKNLTIELDEARSLARQRLATLAKRREEARAVLEQRPAIVAAIEQAKTMGETEARLRSALDAAQTRHRVWEEQSKALAVLRTKAEGLRRQAGDAALRAAGLKQRFGLTDAVPCRGTDLQPRCQLLADAREAQVVLPSADAEVAKIRVTLDAVNAEILTLEATVNELGDTAKAVRAAAG